MKLKIKYLNTVDAKNKLNEMLNEVVAKKKPVAIGKRGKPVAVVVDYETYEREHEGRPVDTTFLSELRNFHQRMTAKYPQGTGDSVDILSEMRRGRFGS